MVKCHSCQNEINFNQETYAFDKRTYNLSKSERWAQVWMINFCSKECLKTWMVKFCEELKHEA